MSNNPMIMMPACPARRSLPPPNARFLSKATYWLALALTSGLGPTRIKKLIEHFGTAERVFHASLTELEATGMRAVSAQSIATGKSLELAQQECAKAVEAGARIISLSDPEYPSRLEGNLRSARNFIR